MHRSLEASPGHWSAHLAPHHPRRAREPSGNRSRQAFAPRAQRDGPGPFGRELDVRVFRARVWWGVIAVLGSFWASVIWALVA